MREEENQMSGKEAKDVGDEDRDRETGQGIGAPGFMDWASLIAAMRRMKNSVFPVDSVVVVSDPRFHGIGIVSRDESCPIEKLAVRVESLNVWWYAIENCMPHAGRMPAWIRSFLRSHNARRARPSLSAKRPISGQKADGPASKKDG